MNIPTSPSTLYDPTNFPTNAYLHDILLFLQKIHETLVGIEKTLDNMAWNE